MTKTITLGQVKQIALEVSKSYELINRSVYYNLIDRRTRQSTLEGGDSNLVYINFSHTIKYMYLALIGENNLYFNWQDNGVQETNDRKNYLLKIENKIVELLCGFDAEKYYQSLNK